MVATNWVLNNWGNCSTIQRRLFQSMNGYPSANIADSDTFTYDNSGRMLTAASGRYTNTVTYTVDTAGRKKTEKLTISGQDYTTQLRYNSRGELTSYDYPDGAVVEREYTDRGELHKIKHNTTVIDTRAYDDGGRMTSSSYNNTVGETRGYNNDNTLASITFSGASIGNMTYSWDANKNKTAEGIAGTMSYYGFTIPAGGYDKEDRLVSYNRASGLNQSWSLSEVGDWDSVTTNSSTQTRTHGPAHELLTGASQNVTSDVKGNMTLIPAALRANSSSLGLSWDFDNRMASADVGNNSSIEVSHSYDALGRRVARTEGSTTTVFVQVGQQTIADYPAGATAAQSTYRYLYASYIDEPVMRWETAQNEAVYFHRNQQYSVIAVTNDTGAIVERYSYTGYGEPAFFNGSGSVISNSQISNRYTYTGREYDSVIRLYHYRARMYDPQLGRFLGRDPIGYVDGYGLYFATMQLSSVDPTGRARWAPPPNVPSHLNAPFPAEQDMEAEFCGSGWTLVDYTPKDPIHQAHSSLHSRWLTPDFFYDADYFTTFKAHGGVILSQRCGEAARGTCTSGMYHEVGVSGEVSYYAGLGFSWVWGDYQEYSQEVSAGPEHCTLFKIVCLVEVLNLKEDLFFIDAGGKLELKKSRSRLLGYLPGHKSVTCKRKCPQRGCDCNEIWDGQEW